MERLNQYFKLKENGTSVKTEVIAGLTTYATMAYMFAVHSSNMVQAGMNQVGVIISMAIVACLATILVGLYAKVPFAMAPGMGESAILAFTVVAGGLATWQVGVGIFAISGIISLLLGILKIRTKMVNVMPTNIKLGAGAAVGVFLVRLGAVNGGLVKGDMSGLGDFAEPAVMLCLIGLLITFLLKFFRFTYKGKTYTCPYYLLISIIVTTIIGIPMGVTTIPQSIISTDLSALKEVAFKAEIMPIFKSTALMVLLLYLTLNDLMSTMGTALGCANKAGFLDENGNMKDIERVFISDGFATSIGGFMGLSNVSCYVESSAGIEAGGRTGLTAITAALLFLVTMFFWPVIVIIPGAATAPALLIVGISMMEGIFEIRSDPAEWAPVGLMLMLTAFTGNYIMGVALGVVSNIIIATIQYALTKERARLPKLGAYILGIIMALYFVSEL